MPGSDTPSLWRDRERIRARLADAPGLVLALDFDGTLAPIVERPAAATLHERVRPQLEGLATVPTVSVAIVSGRALADLRDRVGIGDIAYAGNHGLELAIDGDRTDPADATEWHDAIDRCCRALAERLQAFPAVEIENKGPTATVHLRQVARDRRDAVAAVVEETVSESDYDLRIEAGKAIREIRPPVDWDKGRAVEALLADHPDEWLSVYVGDDVTDEDAFAALEATAGDHLTILVGDRTETTADYRLSNPAAVADFLGVVRDSHGADG